jgi:hypothetical protein
MMVFYVSYDWMGDSSERRSRDDLLSWFLKTMFQKLGSFRSTFYSAESWTYEAFDIT